MVVRYGCVKKYRTVLLSITQKGLFGVFLSVDRSLRRALGKILTAMR